MTYNVTKDIGGAARKVHLVGDFKEAILSSHKNLTHLTLLWDSISDLRAL
jgi:hypothetical protein